MPDSTITWNGVSSSTLGLAIEKYPALNRPGRKYTAYDVPGQNGSAYILQDAWHETVQAYEISVKSPVANFKTIAEWLHSADGYAQLSDSYDSSIYRMAVVVDPFDVENSLNRAGRALVQFRCRPERFMVTNDIEVATPTATSISNPTAHVALPLIRIDGQGYPSMINTAGRTNFTATQGSTSAVVYGLTWNTADQNYIGLHLTRSGSETKSQQISGNVSNVSTGTGTVSFSASVAGYGVGMNYRLEPNTDYTLSAKNTAQNNAVIQIAVCNQYGRILAMYDGNVLANNTRAITFNSGTGSWAVINFAGQSTGAVSFSNIMLNLGTTAQTYTAYSSSTASTFTFGDCIISLSQLYDYMYIDCETMNAYRDPGENLNPLVSILDLYGNPAVRFPRLEEGSTSVKITGTDWITKLTITPRYWTL